MATLFVLVAVIGGALLTYLILETNAVLNAAKLPPQLVEHNFLESAQLLRIAEYCYFLSLLAISIIIHYQRALGNFYIFSTALFMTFVLIDTLLLGESFFHYRQKHDLWQGGFSTSGITGLVLSLAAIIVSSFTYLVLQRLWASRLYQIRKREEVGIIKSE